MPDTDHLHPTAEDTDWAAAVRGSGLRVTPARVAVLAVLSVAGHAAPEEIHRRLATATITLSTVYRTLEALTEAGLVAHTHLGGHQASWSLASAAAHGHLVCRTCGRVAELDDATTGALRESAQRRHGFVVDVAHLSVFGRCAACVTPGR